MGPAQARSQALQGRNLRLLAAYRKRRGAPNVCSISGKHSGNFMTTRRAGASVRPSAIKPVREFAFASVRLLP